MSFIRCLNNPDGAYVFDSFDNCVYFTTKWSKRNNRYQAGPANPFIVPWEIFLGLVKRFIKNHHADSEYKGFSIKECDKFRKFLLTYNGRSIKLWQVTWEYIVNNAERHFLTEKEIIRRIRMQKNY